MEGKPIWATLLLAEYSSGILKVSQYEYYQEVFVFRFSQKKCYKTAMTVISLVNSDGTTTSKLHFILFIICSLGLERW